MSCTEQKDIKILWGKSGNRCAICRIELTQNTSSVHSDYPLGEQAHIVGEKKTAPRGNSSLSINERNSYKNLILLCPNHHTEIDKNTVDYTVECLLFIKTNHEEMVKQSLTVPISNNPLDINGLNLFFRYVPFCSLLIYIEYFPYRANPSFSSVGYMFDIFQKSNPHIYPFMNRELQEKFQKYMHFQLEIENMLNSLTTMHDQRLFYGSSTLIKYQSQNFTEAQDKEIIEHGEYLKSEYVKAYNSLIQFIRNQFSKVNLDTFDYSEL